MNTYVMLTRLSPEAATSPRALEDLERSAVDRIKTLCPAVRWRSSYAVLGPYDYFDVFDAPDNDTATQVAALIRTFGHATTEIWPATDWQHFKGIVRDLPGGVVRG